MPVAMLKPNPHSLVTMVRRNWVGWLPQIQSPVPLNREQVMLLGGAQQDCDQGDAASRDDLLEAGFLLEAGTPIEPRGKTIVALADPGPNGLPADLHRRFRVNHHLALQPYPGGFLAYSGRHGCYVLLPASVALALCASEVAESPDDSPTEWKVATESLVDSLEDYGFIVRSDRGYNTNIRKNEAVAFARYAVSGVSRVLKQVDAELALDGRIPVYFAGCIDLAMDMSYGYLNLALGMLMASVKAYDGGRLADRYFPVPHFLMSPMSVVQAGRTYGPGIVFFSNYIWAHKGNLQAAAKLKADDANFVTVFGGPQAPTYQEAAEKVLASHPEVDIIVRGEGEVTAADLLDKIRWNRSQGLDRATLADVPGLIYRQCGDTGVERTGDRPRVVDLMELSSPYLTGVFDRVPKEILYGATLETNRGCPYGCTFCDWGSATRQKIRQFEMDRVREELDWIGRAGISVLFVADANFGIFKRDVEIAEMIAQTAERYGALKQVVSNYAKNATGTLTEIVRIFARQGLASEGIISIQTRDADTLRVVKRSNIKNERYDELLEVFRAERLPMSTDLMIGLPGATPESFKRDLQHSFETGIQAKAYLTRVLVNSPLAAPEYRREHRVETDERGFMRSCASYSEVERDYMLELFGMYSIAASYGLLKYLLCYLQWDKGILAIDFIDALLRDVKDTPDSYPRLIWVVGFLDSQLHSPGGWRPVLEEVAGFAQSAFGVEWDSALESILQAQEAVLADPDKEAERTYEFEHDVVGYYRGSKTRGKLLDYGAGKLTVRDPYGLCRMNPTMHYQYDTHSVAWELQSDLNDVDRPVFFLEKDRAIVGNAWPKRTTIGQRAW